MHTRLFWFREWEPLIIRAGTKTERRATLVGRTRITRPRLAPLSRFAPQLPEAIVYGAINFWRDTTDFEVHPAVDLAVTFKQQGMKVT
jgi:hypothetical protein